MLLGQNNKPVAIKSLIEFSAKVGSLDRHSNPAPTGLQGIEGHLRVARRRPASYQCEIKLCTEYNGIVFRGRADGYDPASHSLEEIKTFYGKIDKIPEHRKALHWAQIKCYGWMYCQEHNVDKIDLVVVYFNLNEEREHTQRETWTASELKKHFDLLAEIYYQWQRRITTRRELLNQWIVQLRFPFAEMRESQRTMAESVYKAAATGRILLAEAPTGTGKTLAAVFPALKSMSHTAVDKLFYLTVKTTAKQLALDNIALILGTDEHPPLRAIEITAREKTCLELDKQCHGDSCPFAKDFFDKLTLARQAASEIPILDKRALTDLASKFTICPYYLSMEMVRWVDVVVADVNYYFDESAALPSLTQQFEWSPYLLIDESHNLIDRCRQMYSAQLSRGDLLSTRKRTPPAIKKALDKINRSWLALVKTLPTSEQSLTHLADLPEKLCHALTHFTSVYMEYLQNNPEYLGSDPHTQEFFFNALKFQKIAELFDDNFCVDLQNIGKKADLLTLRNLIPARQIAKRMQLAHGTCLFSATLHPPHYYKSLLGLPEDAVFTQVPSPFVSRQLKVYIAQNLSTRFHDRSSAVAPICEIVSRQLQATPGNALMFFSSYDFLQKVERELDKYLSKLDTQILVQSKFMSEVDKTEFIARFSQQSNLLGLAVLGGVFSEGIDLPGNALKGVYIATLGLPQLNSANQHLSSVMQAKFGQGYDFTYTFPGIQKVVQAAGRVIRRHSDEGYVWLLDERFARRKIQSLLPEWWTETSIKKMDPAIRSVSD